MDPSDTGIDHDGANDRSAPQTVRQAVTLNATCRKSRHLARVVALRAPIPSMSWPARGSIAAASHRPLHAIVARPDTLDIHPVRIQTFV